MANVNDTTDINNIPLPLSPEDAGTTWRYGAFSVNKSTGRIYKEKRQARNEKRALLEEIARLQREVAKWKRVAGDRLVAWNEFKEELQTELTVTDNNIVSITDTEEENDESTTTTTTTTTVEG